MKNVSTLNALPRKKVGTNSAKKVREKDQIPVLYSWYCVCPGRSLDGWRSIE